MNLGYHFSVYRLPIILEDGRRIERSFIVIKDRYKNIVQFTDFHKYIMSGRKTRDLPSSNSNRAVFVCSFLNYVFFQKYRLKRLSDVTADMYYRYMEAYGSGELPGDKGKGRSRSTVIRCGEILMSMLQSVKKNYPYSSIRLEELTKEVYRRTSNGDIKIDLVPIEPYVYDSELHYIFRDMPERAMFIILDEVILHHKDILMIVAACAFAGLRPSEACNLRREDSPLGPGIRFDYIFDGEDDPLKDIYLDVSKELCLRSDLKRVGGIKRKRIQKVYGPFIPLFKQCYDIYMAFMKNRYYETEFGALSVNSRGKAYTYKRFSQRIRQIAEDLIPTFLKSDDPFVVNFGIMLQSYNIAPHIFRHWFTVQLVLRGESVGMIQHWRGDRSPESSLTYLNHKSELERQYKKVSSEMFDFMRWKAEKIYGNKKRSDGQKID